MFEHVCDVSCLPMAAVRIGYVIPFPGLNHRHLPEDANRCLIYNVFQKVRSVASDSREDGRLVVGMIIKPASPILSNKAGHKRAIPVHVCLAPASIECEEGIAKPDLSYGPRGRLCGQWASRKNEN